MNSGDRALAKALTQDRWARDCERWSRRSFLKLGLAGSLALSIPDILQLKAMASRQENRKGSVIFLFMAGGPSHLDTFDPKPSAGVEYAGPFKAIATNVDGVQICEHLPKLAQMMDRMALVRSMSSVETSHERAQHLMQTGHLPLASLEYPSYGSVVAKERGHTNYVQVLGKVHGSGAGFFGNAYAPLFAPNPGSYDASKMVGRQAREAFEITREAHKLRDAYGRNAFGQSCLLAARLVEAGVDYVTVTLDGWDTHDGNFETLSERVLPTLDQAVSAMFDDLKRRGLWDSTLIVWTGEFGRTPKINSNAKPGRDHWANAWTVMMAGCGIKGGTVIGRTDDLGMVPVEKSVEPANLAATIYDVIGIDYRKTYETPCGRTVRLAAGEPIEGLR